MAGGSPDDPFEYLDKVRDVIEPHRGSDLLHRKALIEQLAGLPDPVVRDVAFYTETGGPVEDVA